LIFHPRSKINYVLTKIQNFKFLYRFNLVKIRKITKIKSVNHFERKIYSQGGEDGILQIIFYLIGTTNNFFVEIGVDTGKECNTRYLREKENWHGIMFDTNDTGNPLIMIEHVSPENVVSLFKKYDIPHDFDLLSIDIDSNDYWVWKAITYNPRVVVIEYNGYQTVNENKIAKYDPKNGAGRY